MSAYQIAVELERNYPDTFEALGMSIGGMGGDDRSLSRYIANRLSRQIKQRGANHPVEGAFSTSPTSPT